MQVHVVVSVSLVSCEQVHYSTPPPVITLMKSRCKAHRMVALMVDVVVATAADGGNGDVIYDDGRYSSLEWVCSVVLVTELRFEEARMLVVHVRMIAVDAEAGC